MDKEQNLSQGKPKQVQKEEHIMPEENIVKASQTIKKNEDNKKSTQKSKSKSKSKDKNEKRSERKQNDNKHRHNRCSSNSSSRSRSKSKDSNHHKHYNQQNSYYNKNNYNQPYNYYHNQQQAGGNGNNRQNYYQQNQYQDNRNFRGNDHGDQQYHPKLELVELDDFDNVNDFIELSKPYEQILKSRDDNLNLEYVVNLKTQDKQLPIITKIYGDNTLLNETKHKIDGVCTIWDKIKFRLNDFELVDICRNERKANERYSKPIINYDLKKNGIMGIFSRAYFKLWEVLSEWKILDKFYKMKLNIANLAEGPGGFIHCLIDFRNLQHFGLSKQYWLEDNYTAITLKIPPTQQFNASDWEYPRAKTYFDKMRNYKYKINLSYGGEDGNMLKTSVLKYFAEKDLNHQKCELVTGDGGIEVSGDEYDVQELCNAKLFYSEIITALSIQKKRGTFILKIYDSFHDVTIQLLWLLCCFYKSVRITKPHLSRPASSERYVVCEDFLGITDKQMEGLYQLLENWMKVEPNFEKYLQNQQKVSSLLEITNIANYNDWVKRFIENIKLSNELCNQFIMKKINKGLELIETMNHNQEEFQKLTQERLVEQERFARSWCRVHRIPFLKKGL